jgi:HNH endonuclease
LPQAILGRRQQYGPVGRCIYCRATRYSDDREKLAQEHIVPEGIGGSAILLEASCKRCEEAVNKHERIYQNRMFDQIRFRLGISSRKRPAHQRPSTLPVTLIYPDSNEIVQPIPVNEAPAPVGGPILPPPGIWSNRLDADFSPTTYQLLPQNAEIYQKIKLKYGAVAVRSSETSIMIDELVPSLAKIAHSFAVATYGL